MFGVDTTKPQLTGRVGPQRDVSALAVAPDLNRLFLAELNPDRIEVIDLRSQAVVDRYDITGARAFYYEPAGGSCICSSCRPGTPGG